MSGFQYINITIESWSILFCILAVAIVTAGLHIDQKIKRYILSVFLCLAVMLCSDIGSVLIARFQIFPDNRILYTLTFLGNIISYILSFQFICFLLYLVGQHAPDAAKRGKRSVLITARLLLLGEILLLVISQFTGILYFFDDNRSCQRGRLYLLSILFLFAFLVLDSYILIRFRDALQTKIMIPLCCCIIFPLAAIILQFYVIELRLLHFSCALSSITLLIFAFHMQVDQYIAGEKQLAEMQSAVMLSQIQPHFLHNSLVSIAQLCEKDPQQAKEAIINFSEYLRGNMDSLKEKEPIPFCRELEHLKHYLYLEKMRFGPFLKIKLDIQTTDFQIPVLSLQPLAENAIRHGIGMKDEGGTVIISSRETGNHFEICIIDDGVGFQTFSPFSDKAEHIGILNVRRRLYALCRGTLTVISTPGKGTVVTIRIPKEVDTHENTGGR